MAQEDSKYNRITALACWHASVCLCDKHSRSIGTFASSQLRFFPAVGKAPPCAWRPIFSVCLRTSTAEQGIMPETPTTNREASGYGCTRTRTCYHPHPPHLLSPGPHRCDRCGCGKGTGAYTQTPRLAPAPVTAGDCTISELVAQQVEPCCNAGRCACPCTPLMSTHSCCIEGA